MATNAEKGAEVFRQYLGKEDEPGEWFVMEQDRINQFADCTLDHQFIHVDPEACAKLSPYKVPIAHAAINPKSENPAATSIPNIVPKPTTIASSGPDSSEKSLSPTSSWIIRRKRAQRWVFLSRL